MVVVIVTEVASFFPGLSFLFSSVVFRRPGKSKEEVLTHWAPPNITRCSNDCVGQLIWERTRPEMDVSMVTPERVAWEMTPFGL